MIDVPETWLIGRQDDRGGAGEGAGSGGRGRGSGFDPQRSGPDLTEACDRRGVDDAQQLAVEPDLLRRGLVVPDEEGAVAAEAEEPLGGAPGPDTRRGDRES